MQSSSNNLSLTETFRSLHAEAGITRFWRGVSLIALASAPAHASYFSAYEFAKKTLGVAHNGPDLKQSVITGAFATLFHDLIMTPCDGKFILFI